MPSVLGNTPLGTSIALESDLEQQVVAVGKPFDAECEYVTFPAGAYVDPGIVDCGPATEYEVSLKAAHESTGFFRHGCWRGGTTSSYMIYGTTAVSVAKNWINSATFSFSAGTPFAIKVNALSWEANGSTIGSPSNIAGGRQNNARFLICALDNISEGSIDVSQVNIRIYQFDFTSETAIRRLIPVRVGTTGYLYDKVTGRLFASAVPSIQLVPGPDVSTPTFTPKTEIDLLAPLASPAFTGTPTITSTVAAPVVHFSNFTGGGLSGFTGEVRLKGPFLNGAGWVEESAPDPSAIGDFFSGHSICDPGVGFYMLFYDGADYARVSGMDTSSPEVQVYSGSGDVSVDYSTSSRVATMADIGDVNAVLDAINGEVV